LGPQAMVLDWTTQNATMRGALAVERTVMRLILMLIVLVAALNIISGIVMLVKNKTRDIAILRTMGAGQGSILRIFLSGGRSIGAPGTLIGFCPGRAVLPVHPADPAFIEMGLIGRSAVFRRRSISWTRIPARIDGPRSSSSTGCGPDPVGAGGPDPVVARVAARSGGGASL
jgi:lipoprotein-releasing system permease protein